MVFTSWLQDTALFGGPRQNNGIVEAFQRNRLGTPEIQARSAPESARYDRVLEIGISLKSDLHACFANKRFLASSILCWSLGSAGLAVFSNWSHFLSSSRRYASTCSWWPR
jgi:hypothetical protein